MTSNELWTALPYLLGVTVFMELVILSVLVRLATEMRDIKYLLHYLIDDEERA